MMPYKVTAAAKAAFLAAPGATAKPLKTPMTAKVECSSACLRLRQDRNDFATCNAFLVEDGDCKLGYMEPNWFAEQKADPGTAATIYGDVLVEP